MTNQTGQEDLLDISDFYNQLSLNNSSNTTGSKSRLNSKSSSNDLNSDYLFNSISSPSKSSTVEVSSPESLKAHAQNLSSTSRQRLNAPNFNSFKSDSDDSQITKLFVGNLPTSTTLAELLAVFKKYGPVNEKLSVVKDQNYAFIHFYNRKDAQTALQEVNDSLFKDRYIRVQFSTSQGYTFNNKNKFNDKKRFQNSDSQKVQQHTMPHSVSNSSIFTQQPHHHQNYQQSNQIRNFRPIVNKSYQNNMSNSNPITSDSSQQMTQTLNQKFQEYQQTQLMHLLYLAQLQQQQQQMQQSLKFARSNTIDNFAFSNTDLSVPSSTSSTNNILISNALNSQANQDMTSVQNGLARSNTMFSFPNSFNFNR